MSPLPSTTPPPSPTHEQDSPGGDRPSTAAARGVGADQGHAPPLGPDGRQDATRAHAMRNHWWNVTLYPSARGLTTRRIPVTAHNLEIELDLVDHRLSARTTDRSRA